MTNDSHLSTDAHIQEFIYHGLTTVRSSCPLSVHARIHDELQTWFATHKNPSNDLVAHVPALRGLFEDPVIDGVLTGILGPGYLIHRHRHCHEHRSGAAAQTIHKDGPIGGNVRGHHPRNVLIFYYPHTVTHEMGPTIVQPGSQYYMSPQEDLPEVEICCEGGTVVIAHYEIWHRAGENQSADTRFMVKFLGVRTQEPVAPSWRSMSPVWEPPDDGLIGHPDICCHLWRWYRGMSAGPSSHENRSVENTDLWTDLDTSGIGERRRLNSYYRAAQRGTERLPDFMTAMIAEAERKWASNLTRGDFTNPSQLDTPFGLAAMGVGAVSLLIEHLTHPSPQVRSAAAVTLGIMGAPAHGAVNALSTALKDDNEWVRRNAAEALGHIGERAEAAISFLIAALEDTRPVTAWSLSPDSFRENVLMALLKIIPDDRRGSFSMFRTLENDASEYIRSWAKRIVDGVWM